MKILIIDNYDSFSHNLFHLVEAIIPDECVLDIKRNDAISIEQAGKYDKIIISPGPGLPRDAGITCEVIKRFSASKSILGVCLGLQAITEVFGGGLLNLEQVLHGTAVPARIISTDELLFRNCPRNIETGRYHSWVADPDSLPLCLEVTATDADNQIMALRHIEYDVRGVQFHPESIMTPYGRLMLENWLMRTECLSGTLSMEVDSLDSL